MSTARARRLEDEEGGAPAEDGDELREHDAVPLRDVLQTPSGARPLQRAQRRRLVLRVEVVLGLGLVGVGLGLVVVVVLLLLLLGRADRRTITLLVDGVIVAAAAAAGCPAAAARAAAATVARSDEVLERVGQIVLPRQGFRAGPGRSGRPLRLRARHRRIRRTRCRCSALGHAHALGPVSWRLELRRCSRDACNSEIKD